MTPERIARVVASVQGSTCERDYPGTADLLRGALEAQAARAAGAAEARARRTAEVEARVRAAVGALPVDARGLVGIVQRRMQRPGFGPPAGERVIRRVLVEMQKSQPSDSHD